MDLTLLQIFLLVNVFFIGMLTVIAIQHAFAHFKPRTHDAEKAQTQAAAHLPADVKDKLLRTSQANFQAILDDSAAELERDLKTTTARLNKHLERLGLEIVGDETKRYRMELDNLRTQGEAAINQAQIEFTSIIKNEMQHYRTSLESLRNKSETTIGEAQAEITETIKNESQHYRDSIEGLCSQTEAAINQAASDITGTIKNETKRYSSGLETMYSQAETAIQGAQAEITGTVKNETQRYSASIDGMYNQIENAIKGAQAEITGHQAEINAKLASIEAELIPKLTKEIASEKQRLVQQIDTKLADAMASFLMETLQHNIDLGAQNDYLISMLEEHKAEFTGEVTNEV